MSNQSVAKPVDELDNIIGFQNTNDGALGVHVKGLGKCTLWNKGDVIRDREGNPVINADLNTPSMRAVGLMPVFRPSSVTVPDVKPESILEPSTNEAPPVQAPPVKEVTQPQVAQEPDKTLPQYFCKQEAPSTPGKDPVWVYNKDGFKSSSIPGMKAHIRSVDGPETLEKLEWIRS